MSIPVHNLLRQQIARASRRLFVQTLVDSLIWCWVGALALSAGWFLVQLYLLGMPLGWRSWAMVGGALGLGTVVALVAAFFRAPSRLAAALLLDERFGLKERVTTFFTLTPDVERTSAGQALLADVQERVVKLDVSSRFPVRLRWTAALVPGLAVLLLLGACFLEPLKSQAQAGAKDNPAEPPANAVEIKEKMEQLAKKNAEQKATPQEDKSEKLQQIEAELDKLVNRPRDTKEALRERVNEINDLEQDMKKREKELADKAQALKEQLKNLDRFSKRNDPDGPATPLEKALANGDFQKAMEEAEKLGKRLEEQKLTEEEKEQLQKQLASLKDDLKRIAEQKDEEEKLEELSRKGEIDEDTLQREMERIKNKKANLKEMKEVAQELEQCQQCMAKGDSEGASQALKKAMGKMKRLGADDQELQDIANKLQSLQECKNCIGEGMSEDKEGNGLGKGKFPGTRRPETKDADYKAQLKRERVNFDVKGRKEITDFVQGRTFKKTPSAEMAGEVKQASQEAPEAVERQRLPRAASDMTRGYYENLRQEADKDKPGKK